MSVCNRAQFEHVRRSMRRVSTMRALQKSASEAMLSGPVKKKFTIVDTRTGQVSEHRRPTVPDADGLPGLENGVRSEEPVPVSTHPTTGRTKSRKNDIFGIPSDVALVKYVELNASVEAIRQRYHNEARYVVMMKGAPEAILGKCKKARVNKDVVDIDDNFRQECQMAWESLGNAGRRVIAFAQAHFNAPMNAKFGAGDRWPEDLVFLGMAAIMDPPR
ncbi:hypothetical protein TELCIR_11408 [Teladorsagia circumcincta]|uniref:Uncharacterized protein n=1 Tax=Teladorsagia circumcincta TaxID=45464 RepID=A0A2G9U9H2_TELCI|nr:hypothetical protein TELCIR_11408 [Teladorsagia circumcincta]